MRIFQIRILLVSIFVAIIVLGVWVAMSTRFLFSTDSSGSSIQASSINVAGLQAGKREERERTAEVIRNEHLQLIRCLIKLSAKEDDFKFSYYDWHDSKHLAILLLGDMRSADSVPVMLGNLEYRNPLELAGSYMDVGGWYPTAEALSKIGMPAVGPVIDKLGRYSEQEKGHSICCWIIKEILGPRLGKVRLEMAIEDTKDETVKKNLTAALPYFKTEKEKATEERARREKARNQEPPSKTEK